MEIVAKGKWDILDSTVFRQYLSSPKTFETKAKKVSRRSVLKRVSLEDDTSGTFPLTDMLVSAG